MALIRYSKLKLELGRPLLGLLVDEKLTLAKRGCDGFVLISSRNFVGSLELMLDRR